MDQPDTKPAVPTNAKLFDNLATNIAAARGAHRRTARAREGRGVKLGRKLKPTEHQKRAIKRCEGNGEAIREIARSDNVCHSTISRRAAEILCSSGLSNGMAVEIFWRAKPTAKQQDR